MSLPLGVGGAHTCPTSPQLLKLTHRIRLEGSKRAWQRQSGSVLAAKADDRACVVHPSKGIDSKLVRNAGLVCYVSAGKRRGMPLKCGCDRLG